MNFISFRDIVNIVLGCMDIVNASNFLNVLYRSKCVSYDEVFDIVKTKFLLTYGQNSYVSIKHYPLFLQSIYPGLECILKKSDFLQIVNTPLNNKFHKGLNVNISHDQNSTCHQCTNNNEVQCARNNSIMDFSYTCPTCVKNDKYGECCCFNDRFPLTHF